MKLHIVTGFLGSGKTTAIHRGVTLLLKQNIPVAVITNDQGSRLVDGDLFDTLGIPSKQVKGGCFCCNYNELENNIQTLAGTSHPTIIFAEAVGSCTDIVATVLKPLQTFNPAIAVSISTFTDIRLLGMILGGNHSFDESVAYIYYKQLEEAEIIIINKTDTVSREFIDNIKKQLSEKYPVKLLLFQNSLQEADIHQWLRVLDNFKRAGLPSSLTVDYDVYATGEGKMAWYDQQLEIYNEDSSAVQIGEELMNSIYANIVDSRTPIGHIKFLIDGVTKISFTNEYEEPVKLQLKPASSINILINIRVQQSPAFIEELVNEILETVKTKCTLVLTKPQVFSPGYPSPVHRM
jgi:Ni2+-binding GTPase involved in maturation of urease and hydrogenase